MAAPVLEQAADPVAVLAQVHALLGSVSTTDYAALGSSGQREAATSLARLKARVTAHELAAVAAVERSGAARTQGATSTGSLLARNGPPQRSAWRRGFGGDRREADARVRQAKCVESTPVSHRAMADGVITPRQARVIRDALDLLPQGVAPGVRKACEAQLVDHAQRLDLPTFKRRADRVVGSFMVEPDDADALNAAENQIVEDRERRAWAKAEFWMSPADRDGAVKGGFVLPEAQAAMLKTAMDTLMAPQVDIVAPGDVRRTTLENTRLLDEKTTYTRRLGWAFAHLCELLPTDELPAHEQHRHRADRRHRRRVPARQAQDGHPLHRRQDLRRRGPQAGVRPRHPARGHGRSLAPPRPRSDQAALHHPPTHGVGPP